jgi:hypothetical protein
MTSSTLVLHEPAQSVVIDSMRYEPVIAVPVALPGGSVVTTSASSSPDPPVQAIRQRQTRCFMPPPSAPRAP